MTTAQSLQLKETRSIGPKKANAMLPSLKSLQRLEVRLVCLLLGCCLSAVGLCLLLGCVHRPWSFFVGLLSGVWSVFLLLYMVLPIKLEQHAPAFATAIGAVYLRGWSRKKKERNRNKRQEEPQHQHRTRHMRKHTQGSPLRASWCFFCFFFFGISTISTARVFARRGPTQPSGSATTAILRCRASTSDAAAQLRNSMASVFCFQGLPFWGWPFSPKWKCRLFLGNYRGPTWPPCQLE